MKIIKIKSSGCRKKGCTWAGSAKMIPLNLPLAKKAA
jgi:hypothetical protein